MEGQINSLQKKLGDKINKDFKEKIEQLKFNEGSLWMSKDHINSSRKVF